LLPFGNGNSFSVNSDPTTGSGVHIDAKSTATIDVYGAPTDPQSGFVVFSGFVNANNLPSILTAGFDTAAAITYVTAD
jgi:hypothetical protein